MAELPAALAGAMSAPVLPATRRRVLVVGAVAGLGADVVESLLAHPRFPSVGVLAHGRVQPAMRSLRVVAADDASITAFGADTALVVFDRQRHSRGRDAAFVRPAPEDLAAWGRRLHAAGVRHFLVAVPHQPALMPEALKLGLATLDEAAVAAAGFDHVVLMRIAQARGADPAGAPRHPGDRLAAWMLSQLTWLVPQRDQPVRTAVVARVAVAIAAVLPEAGKGVRVTPPELLQLVAQGGDAQDLGQRWLAGQPLPSPAQRQRW